MKFVMTQAICQDGLELLKDVANVYVADNSDPNNYLEEMQDADALIVRIAKCDKNVILNSPNLKVIGRTGVGYDSVDVKTATEKGIPVVITPGANNRAVAEHTVGLMFAVAKNIVEAQNEMKKGNFEIRSAGKAFELQNKKVGFIGLGSIGREALKICKGIGMDVLGYDPYLTKEDIENLGATYFENFETMIKVSDFVSIHVPLVESTQNMIGKKQLETMKKTAILINCSRGGIVKEDDLVEALNDGIIDGAGFDVFVEEPPSIDNPLLNAKNLVYSPHSAAQTKEAVVNMATMCVEGCMAIINGEKWPHVADKSVYDHPKWNNK